MIARVARRAQQVGSVGHLQARIDGSDAFDQLRLEGRGEEHLDQTTLSSNGRPVVRHGSGVH